MLTSTLFDWFFFSQEEDAKDAEEDLKEDDWYSSDDEGGSSSAGPLATILNKLKAQPSESAPPPKVAMPSVSLEI